MVPIIITYPTLICLVSIYSQGRETLVWTYVVKQALMSSLEALQGPAGDDYDEDRDLVRDLPPNFQEQLPSKAVISLAKDAPAKVR